MSNHTISDTARIINVENHVLRNWEDELSLRIPRNDLGHRIYTDDDILKLKTIKKLKYHGFSLKHIKLLLPYFKKIDKLTTNELINLKDNFFTILQNRHSHITNNSTSYTSKPYDASAATTLTNDTPSLDKLKPIIHYIITDFITTILASKHSSES